MNTRICSVIAVAMIVTLSGGCSGVRNFLFGRGARCGSCQNMTPQFGNTMQAPCSAPTCQAPAPCGCNEVYAAMPCGECGTTGCGCGQSVSGYGPAVTDPYITGGVVADPYGGQVISDQVIGTQPAAPVQSMPTAPIQPDNFSARKFDSDGNRILWEQPLPSGAKSL